MWCNKCGHGHTPDANGMCPCSQCGNQMVVIKKVVIGVEDVAKTSPITKS